MRTQEVHFFYKSDHRFLKKPLPTPSCPLSSHRHRIFIENKTAVNHFSHFHHLLNRMNQMDRHSVGHIQMSSLSLILWCVAVVPLHTSVHTLPCLAARLSFLMTSSLTSRDPVTRSRCSPPPMRSRRYLPHLSALRWRCPHIVYFINRLHLPAGSPSLTCDPFQGLRSIE